MSNDQESKIRDRTYRIWEEAGMPEGRAEHWLRAEKEIGETGAMPAPTPETSAPPKKKA